MDMTGDELVMHLRLSRNMLGGAKLAFVPGDPGRVEGIVRAFDPKGARPLASNREYNTWQGTLDGHSVLCASTGIGGPSTSIAVEELAMLGVRTFIRIGTTGSIQKHVQLGDLVITSASVRLDGASRHYAPIEYPAAASFAVVEALVRAGRNRPAIKTHVGVTASTDTFYPGQERNDSYAPEILKDLRGSLREWQRLGVLNYEMESATLLTMCAALGLRAGCVAGVVAYRLEGEVIRRDAVLHAEEHGRDIAIEAARALLSEARP